MNSPTFRNQIKLEKNKKKLKLTFYDPKETRL